jgi:hypothetical protein
VAVPCVAECSQGGFGNGGVGQGRLQWER